MDRSEYEQLSARAGKAAADRAVILGYIDGPPGWSAAPLQPRFEFGARPAPSAFTFIDLFAGIGGLRLGFQAAGGRCIFTSEWDQFSRRTYAENFPDDDHELAGDIRQVHEQEIPPHDVLLAGFPCQPFSIAGVSKKMSLGRPHGFADETQGTLFFDVARIIAHHRPKAFLLENVKNLVSHDQGRTFAVIRRTLAEDLGYDLHWKILDAAAWVPQHRERIFLVGFRDRTAFAWDQVRSNLEASPTLSAILHPENGTEPPEAPWTFGDMGRVHARYSLTPHMWAYLQGYAEKHRARGNGFGFGLCGPSDIARTLSARYYKDGSEILIRQTGDRPPRRLTPRECARLMGFDNETRRFRISVSDTQAYRQFGNAVVVPVVEGIAREMIRNSCGLGMEELQRKWRDTAVMRETRHRQPLSPSLHSHVNLTRV